MSSTTRKLVYLDGKPHWLTEEERIERGLEKEADVSVGITSGYSEGRPGRSIGMSCHPSQIGLMNSTLQAHGITGVRYVPGKRVNCEITNRRDRARAMKVVGPMLRVGLLHDEDGGYGDG